MSSHRFTIALAALLALASTALAQPTPAAGSPDRVDDDVVFSDWIPAQQSAAELDVFEVNVGRTFAPERIREIRVWVDTVGLFRFDDACEDGDATACADSISFEEIRRQELFKGQTKYPNTTSLDVADSGEVFVFRATDSGDEFNRVKAAMIDGKFKVRVGSSSAFEFALKRVHVTVLLRPAKRR
jgi:hypothetical protein